MLVTKSIECVTKIANLNCERITRGNPYELVKGQEPSPMVSSSRVTITVKCS